MPISVATLALALYLNALPNTFIFDDWQQIVDNPFLRRPDALLKIFTTGVWEFLGPIGTSNFYRPLMHAAFYLAFGWFGLNPAGYHAVSILLHAAVSLMGYAVVARLTGDRLVAGGTALLFAAHPVHVEAVAWISAYPELLCAFFSLLAVWLYLRAEGNLWLQLAVGPAMLLGLLAKEIAAAVPALLVCSELLALRRPNQRARWREVARQVAPAFASLAVCAAVYLAARLYALGTLFPASSKPIPHWERLWTTVALFFRYLWVQLWPWNLHAFYYLERNRGPLEPAVLAGFVTFVAVLALGWALYRRGRPEALAVPLYLLPLAPAFLLPYASVGLLMAERYVYLPSLGFCWLVAAALAAAGRRWGSRRIFAVFVLLLAAYSARTVLRNRDWRDEVAFYRDAIANFPGFPRAHLNLGEALMRRNRVPEAIEATKVAASLDPKYSDPHVNLGLLYWRQKEAEPAIHHFHRAASLASDEGNRFVASRALANLAVVYRGLGRLDEAVAASRRALAADPHFAGAHNNLGYALLVQGQVEEAVRHFQKALDLDPVLDVAHSNLGLALAMRREWDAALMHLRRAAQLNPQNGEVRARIGEVYLARGQTAAALDEFHLALRLDPSNERARHGRQAAGASPEAR